MNMLLAYRNDPMVMWYISTIIDTILKSGVVSSSHYSRILKKKYSSMVDKSPHFVNDRNIHTYKSKILKPIHVAETLEESLRAFALQNPQLFSSVNVTSLRELLTRTKAEIKNLSYLDNPATEGSMIKSLLYETITSYEGSPTSQRRHTRKLYPRKKTRKHKKRITRRRRNAPKKTKKQRKQKKQRKGQQQKQNITR
jgi:type IV secretory pathway VirB6-like protein